MLYPFQPSVAAGFILAAICLLETGPLVHAVETGTDNTTAEEREFFEKQVRPLLIKRCFECHGGTKAAGALSLVSRKGWQQGGESGPAIVPGKPEESLLISAIQYRDLEMPPQDKGGKLSDEEIAILTKWVAIGAPDPRDGTDVLGGMTRDQANMWWAFQPLPEVAADASAANAGLEIDRLIERQWPANVNAAPLADKRTLIRRVTYDLTGLPPTIDEVQDFLADQSPEAFSKVIDRLLESPQYGVQWGRHWLDVVRYADTAGENTDRPLPHAWRYRNWVIDAFNRDLPYDQFVRLQIAGDLLMKDHHGSRRADGIIATGYLAIARRFGHDIDQDMYLTYEDVIDNLGKSFLGLSLGCARCHDHKYDPVSTEDYYALYGIFESTRFAFPGCEPKGQPRDLVPLLNQAEVDAILKPWQAKVAEAEAEKQRRQAAAKSATENLRTNWSTSKRKLVEAPVAEGKSVAFEQRVTIRRGEIVLLTVLPNGNHGADSTLVEIDCQEVGGQQRQWNTRDIIDELTQSNPSSVRDADWSFIEVQPDGPAFLNEKADSINGNGALKKWSSGDTPSVFVNSSEQSVTVWTTLPARSFFVHPGPQRPVAVAWTSPLDGEIMLSGRVADAHPAGLDGVSFELHHFAEPTLGTALATIGDATIGLPSAGESPFIPVAYAVVDQSVKNARVQKQGDPEKLGDEVPRRWLSVFGGAEVPAESGSGRLELANWIAAHPLAARVMVNRVWEWHFGRGLVGSANDFGARGEAPTHPELLNLLAAKFAHSGYSVKALHRLLLQTEAYQRASSAHSASDPENRWLAHVSRRRLTAEELRDSLLAVSNSLDQTPGEAHPFPAEKTWGFTQHAPFDAIYETNRRSAYLMVQRQRRHPFLTLFDGADPNASTPTRQTTTVPTQALYFLNDNFFHEQSARVAERALAASHDAARLSLVVRTLFQREATQAEQDRLQGFLAKYPGEPIEKWAAWARVLLASNEFLFVE